MSTKEQAIEQIVDIANEHSIGVDEIVSRLSRTSTGADPANLLVKVLSYIGGTFIFAGIAIFIALQWDELNSLTRILVTLGTGVSLFAAGIIAIRDPRFAALTSPLLAASAILQPIGLLVVFAEYSSGGDERVAGLVTACTFALQFGVATLKWHRILMTWFTIFFGSVAWGVALDLIEIDGSLTAVTLGTSWLCLGLATVGSRQAILAPQLFGFGCWALLAGVFDLVQGTALEVLFVFVTCSLIYLGGWAKSRTLNLASSAALLGYTAYFTGNHFADSTGWPIALILIGIAMMGIGMFTLRIDRRLRDH